MNHINNTHPQSKSKSHSLRKEAALQSGCTSVNTSVSLLDGGKVDRLWLWWELSVMFVLRRSEKERY